MALVVSFGAVALLVVAFCIFINTKRGKEWLENV